MASFQLGKNSVIGLKTLSTAPWGTEQTVNTLMVGWGGASGVANEMINSSAAGEVYQQTDTAGLIKAHAEVKVDLAFSGFETLLAACFGQAVGAPSGSAATGYTHVFDFPAEGNNILVSTIANYEGLADEAAYVPVNRTARSCKLNQWNLDIPKSGPAKLDTKWLADFIIESSLVNTPAVLQALTTPTQHTYRGKITGSHFSTARNNNGYIRLGPVGNYTISAPRVTTVAASTSGIWTIGAKVVTAFPAPPCKLTLTFNAATTFDYVTSSGATGSGTDAVAFTITFKAGCTQALTFTKSGTFASGDTVTAWFYYDATGTDIALGATNAVLPNHHKYSVDWHLDGANGPSHCILDPFSKSQPTMKADLDFDDDVGTIDPYNILRGIKYMSGGRSEGIPIGDYKIEAYGESALYAGTGAAALRYSILIQIPRASVMWKDGAISGPGPQAGKFEFKVLKPFAAPVGMTGVTGPMRITIVSTLATAPAA